MQKNPFIKEKLSSVFRVMYSFSGSLAILAIPALDPWLCVTPFRVFCLLTECQIVIIQDLKHTQMFSSIFLDFFLLF